MNMVGANANVVTHAVMAAWVPFVLLLFFITTPRRAVVISFVGAWLFLPVYGYSLPGLPDFTKTTASGYAIMLGIVLFDAGRLVAFRPSIYDLPMLVWLLCPLVSAPMNDLEVYDGLSLSLQETATWGLPYFIGRLYFTDVEGLHDLALGIVIGGLIYVPFCILEARLSPQIHKYVYGFFPHTNWQQTKRWGGWRPNVFMQHGLMVGMWMGGATIVASWLWFSGAMKRLWLFRMWQVAVVLGATAVICKSSGALVLMMGGLGFLVAMYMTGTRLVLALALSVPVTYVTARVKGWDASEIVDMVATVSVERSESVAYRVEAEVLLLERALEQPIFGWAGWGRNKVESQDDVRHSYATDSMWIIAIGVRGLVGLIGLGFAVVAPPWIMVRYVGPAVWRRPEYGAVAAIAAIVLINAYDNMFNAMLNPVFIIAMGGVMGFGLRRQNAALPDPPHHQPMTPEFHAPPDLPSPGAPPTTTLPPEDQRRAPWG